MTPRGKSKMAISLGPSLKNRLHILWAAGIFCSKSYFLKDCPSRMFGFGAPGAENSCWGCLRPPWGGTLAMVPSMIFSNACCTPSPDTSRVIEGLSDFHACLSFPRSSMAAMNALAPSLNMPRDRIRRKEPLFQLQQLKVLAPSKHPCGLALRTTASP